MGRLIIVTGPPVAGKSTVAGSLISRFELGALIAGDEFFGFITSGYIHPWLAEAHQQNEIVIAAAARAAGRMAEGGYTVVYDGVVGPWFLEHFVAEASIRAVDYVLLLPPELACLERVRDRRDHPFSDPAATSQVHREFARADVDERHVLVDGETAQQTADTIFGLLASRRFEWTA